MNAVDLAELGLRTLYEIVHDDAMDDLLDALDAAAFETMVVTL